MGSGHKKRKQQQDLYNVDLERDVKRKSRAQQAAVYPRWENHNGITVATMQHGQSLLFLGEAVLTVLQGCIDVAGKLLTMDSPPVKLSTAGRNSLAITITASHTPGAQGPPAAGAPELAEFTLQQPPLPAPAAGGADCQAADGAAAAAGGGSGSQQAAGQQQQAAFSLHLASGAGSGGAPSGSGSGAATPPAPPSVCITPEWAAALECITQAASAASAAEPGSGSMMPVVALAGGKGVGKSTLARLMVNHLLNVCPVVAFLDTDCGQPEVTPPGMVSLTLLRSPLLGPPCTHLQQTHRAHFMGDTSPQINPQMYIAAVQSLYGSYCSPELADASGRWPPLVVNLHGWIAGMGYDILVELLQSIGPTHLVQVRSGPDRKNLPLLPFWWPHHQQPCPTQLLHLQSAAGQQQAGQGQDDEGEGQEGEQQAPAQGKKAGQPQSPLPGAGAAGTLTTAGSLPLTVKSLKPVQSRALLWHAWAKQAAGRDCAWGSYESDDFFATAHALAAAAPYEVDLAHVRVQFPHGGAPHAQELPALLNGALVGLAASGQAQQQPQEEDPAAAAAGQEQDPAAQAAVLQVLPGGELLPCVGLGLVRAVDVARGRLLLLTAVGEEQLQDVDVLQVGKTDLPNSLLQAGELATPYLTLFAMSGGDAAGAVALKGRKNLGRTGLVDSL